LQEITSKISDKLTPSICRLQFPFLAFSAGLALPTFQTKKPALESAGCDKAKRIN